MTSATPRVEIRRLERTDTATINMVVPLSEIGSAVPTIFRDVYEYLASLGMEPELAFGRYAPMGQEMFIHAGFTVPRPVPAKGRIKPGELPGGEAAVYLHVGPYDKVEAAYRAIGDWMTREGRVSTGEPWEVYLSPPEEVPPRTEVVFPLVPRDSEAHAAASPEGKKV
ncbi:MAG TPA: GyrI-like domain-containing protein [Dehalococcoidia bacterium]|nr:GyrI-like domain-containing protein [Dehalococcoidia bacterium]